MKSYFLILFSAICLTACSSSDDASINEEDMTMEENMDMEDEATYSGNFISVAHPTSGVASVNKEKTVLKLSNFKSDEGPSLELYLATDANASEYISLGALKGLDGEYEYDIPDNVDFSEYNYVIVWCVPFGVNFGNAILEMN
ncbi:DM13 domain-containing protein [Tamlana sp. I1]|uniref:DM13 domain-containing protein n=1 Tax=Tamlana sp. I1 TaxID=2762061 RepID=UPI00189098DF|nr:DM13 domain-containing protein [Tamlana sp. I1]